MGTMTLPDLTIQGYDPTRTAGDCYFDEEAAIKKLESWESVFQFVEGEKAGQPFVLEGWQKIIVWNAYGWKRPGGLRRYRIIWIFVPRKNGKTCLGSAFINDGLFFDTEPMSQIYTAAADIEQASLVWNHVTQMIRHEEEMKKRCVIYTSSKTILTLDHRARFKVLSHDADTKHGTNTQLAVIDEVHAHQSRRLIDVLMTSVGSRREPLLIFITTADYDRPSICNELLKYARNVRDNPGDEARPGYDASFLPVIYETPADADWKSPDVWRAANPNLGVSIKEEAIRQECQRAMESPAYENTFKRLHLNMPTEQAVRLVAMDDWDKCARTIQPETLLGKACFGALDLSSTTDISSLVLFFPEPKAALCWFWIPKENAEKRELRDRVPYLTWARQKFLAMTEGNVIDYTFIRRRINEVSKQYDLRGLAFDPWNARHLAQQLQDEDGIQVVEFSQNFQSMNEPCKALMAMILRHDLQHFGNPVLRWMAANIAGKSDAKDNIMFDKKNSADRIDGMVALAMAVGLSLRMPLGIKKSVYDTKGLTWLGT